MSTSVTESEDGRLFELYARYVGEPQSRKDVYGYWLFLFGSVVSFVGIVVYLLAPSSPSSPGQYVLREISTTLAAFGLPLALLGILLLLPVKRRGIQASVLGTLIAEGAVVGFVWAYPTNWTVGTPDYSGTIIAVYTAGTVIVVGTAALVPVVTGEKSFFFEEEYEREEDHPDVMVGEGLRGGVFSVFKRDDEWQWRLIEQDARAGGTEGFLSRLEAEETVDRIRELVGQAGLLELKNVAFRLYRGAGDRWRWVLTRADGSVIAESHDQFDDRDGAADSVGELKELGPDAELLEIDGAGFDIVEAEGGWSWELVDEDRSTMATAPGVYPDRSDAEEAADHASAAATGADDLAIDSYGIELVGARAATDGGDAEIADEEDEESADPGPGGINLPQSPDSADDEDLPESTDGEKGDESDLPDAAEEDGDLPDRPEETAEGSDLPESIEDDGDLPERQREGPETDVSEEYEADIDAWQWRVVDSEAREIARASRHVDTRREAESAAYDLFEALGDAPVIEANRDGYEVIPEEDGWRWRLFDADGRAIAGPPAPGRAPDEATATHEAETLREGAASAPVVHIEGADFEYYPGEDAGWRWRLVTSDREILAQSVGSHPSREAVADAVDEIGAQVEAADLIEYEDAAFQVYEAGEEWRWRLIDEDGNVMADSGAEFESRDEAFSSMMTVKENAPNAETLEIETAAFELYEGEEPDDPAWNWRLVDRRGETTARGAGYETEEAARESMERVRALADVSSRAMDEGTFQVYADEEEWRWRFVTPHDTTVAESERTWATRDEVETAIDEDIRTVADGAPIHTIESVAVELVDKGGEWTWRVRDSERTELATSSMNYGTREEAERTVDELRTGATDFPVFALTGGTFVISRSAQAWRWQLVDDEWTTLAEGGTTFTDRDGADDAVDVVGRLLPEAGTIEYEDAAFELYEEEPEPEAGMDEDEAPDSNWDVDRSEPDDDGETLTWNWRLIDEAGEVIAAGAGGYASRAEAADALSEVRSEVADASVIEIDTAAFDLHRDDDGWRWRLVDQSGEPVAESLEAHDTRREAREAMDFVKEEGPDAMTTVAE